MPNLGNCRIGIIALGYVGRPRAVEFARVPTTIDAFKRADLAPLIAASASVGKLLKKGDVVVTESAVYPRAARKRVASGSSSASIRASSSIARPRSIR